MYLYDGIIEEGEGSAVFDRLFTTILVICLFLGALHYFFQILDMISESRKKKRYETRNKQEDCTDRPAPAAQKKEQQYSFVEKKVCVDDYIEEKKTTPTECRHVRCGTPFLEARRREANNEHGWKDVTGHILSNEEVDLFRKYYFVYMTPIVHKMLYSEWAKNEFDYIISRSTFPQKPYTEREFEVHFYYHMMMPIVESLIPKYFVADRELTEKVIYDIADDILGEQDHDFDWLDRTYGIRWH
jgi:hypothetical protein